MKHAALTGLLIASFCVVSSAQAPKGDCPTISITGPSDVTQPGWLITFTAKVANDYRGGYKWSVSAGNIESDRANYWINVRVPSDIDTASVTATVELDGLLSRCANTASETAGVAAIHDIFPIDTYERLSRIEELARLEVVARQLAKSPGSIVYVIIRTPKRNAKAIFASRKRTVETFLARLREKSANYTIIDGGILRLETVIYIFPRELIPTQPIPN